MICCAVFLTSSFAATPTRKGSCWSKTIGTYHDLSSLFPPVKEGLHNQLGKPNKLCGCSLCRVGPPKAWDYESMSLGFLNINNFKWLQLRRFSEGLIRFYMKHHALHMLLSKVAVIIRSQAIRTHNFQSQPPLLKSVTRFYLCLKATKPTKSSSSWRIILGKDSFSHAGFLKFLKNIKSIILTFSFRLNSLTPRTYTLPAFTLRFSKALRNVVFTPPIFTTFNADNQRA